MNVVKFLANLIFKKQIQKQKGIMKILPGDKVDAEKKAEAAIKKLQENANINVNNLKESDLEFIAEDIVNPFKYAEKTPIKSADILPFRFKRSFAEELADASKKGDFTRMSGIMKLDPKFKEVIKAFNKSKADEKAYKEMVGPKKLIPDRDVIPYQSPEVQKLSPKEKLARTTLTEDQYKDVLKKGYGIDDVIYAQDFYGDTAEDVIRRATEKGTPVAFADGGRIGFAGGGNGEDDGITGITMSIEERMERIKKLLKQMQDIKKGVGIDPDPEDMADGGRIGFAGGTPSPSILDVLPPDFDDFSTDELKHLIKLLQAGEIPQFADGGVAGLLGERPGYQDGLGPVGSVGPVFKTNKPKDAFKEIISRMIGVEPAKIPLSDKDALTLMFDLDRAMIGGQKNIFGGELNFGINKGFGQDDTGIGFNFTKQFASGGRVPFSMGRRAFLKLMGSVGAGIGAAKAGLGSLFKAGKPVAKDLTQVPIENAEGMPSWFKPLVNRVIKEGTETTNLPPNKGGAYLDRQIVHSAKLGEGQGVRVYQNLDDQTINVEYQSVDNLGGVDDGIVNLEYRAPQDIYDTGPASVMSKEYQATKKASGQYPKKSAAEFEAHEAYPYQDPKDYKTITFEGDNTVSEVKDLHSDISALKQFGTNKPLTKKELEIAKQKRQRVKEIQNNPSEELAGSGPDYDDFAFGGRAGYVFGGMVAESLVENNPKVFGNRLYEDLTDRERMEVYGAGLEEASTNFAKQFKMKRAMDKASRPTKTLEGIEKTGTIDISDDAVAEEFTNFMKETDPAGYSKIQKVVDDANQQLELKRFKTKGRKKNASGGLARMLGE
jgi:hypothetical protein